MKILYLLLILFFVGFSKPKKNNKCMEIQSIYIYDYFEDYAYTEWQCHDKMKALISDSTIQKIYLQDTVVKTINKELCLAKKKMYLKYKRTGLKNIFCQFIDASHKKHDIVISQYTVLDFTECQEYFFKNKLLLQNLFFEYFEKFENK
jgi:hypothetical protein